LGKLGNASKIFRAAIVAALCASVSPPETGLRAASDAADAGVNNVSTSRA